MNRASRMRDTDERYQKMVNDHLRSQQPPTRQEYYNDKTELSITEDLELYDQEMREATGILSNAALHVVKTNTVAATILMRLRGHLIEDEFHNRGLSDAARFRTLFLYRKNTVGIPPLSRKENPWIK